MFRQLTFYRIAFLNMLLVMLLFLLDEPYLLLIQVAIFFINLFFLSILAYNLPRFLKHNHRRLFLGKKRTFILFISSFYICTVLFSLYFKIAARDLLIIYILGTTITSIAYLFAGYISSLFHKAFKKTSRIVIVGYDDNALKLAEKLKKKSNSYFVSHLNHEAVINNANAEILSDYINYAKKHQIKEFYISVPQQENGTLEELASEAEKHCIRVNFIAPQQNFIPGFYHIKYIGGLPVLIRYKEPLQHLHNQILKRCFDLLVSTLVIIFILSWLIPIVSLLIKLESKGPVFFKQLRSGRDNNSFTCLKFRSMRINESSDLTQATKNDSRITRIGAFLRRTSLDEYPQFLNVFMGDMSVVGPRPHMLSHTEEYSGQVNHYMVRLFLKPGLTGWAQVNGYRGETRNIKLMEQRVEHDIWYMENWSTLLDIKIMYLTLMNILKGDENAY